MPGQRVFNKLIVGNNAPNQTVIVSNKVTGPNINTQIINASNITVGSNVFNNWILVSNNSNVSYSSDGINFSNPVVIGNYFRDIEYNGSNMCVAASYENSDKLFYSYNFQDWNLINQSLMSHLINEIKYENGMWVACGVNNEHNLIYSFDGLNWFPCTTSNGYTSNLDFVSVAWGNGLWVTGGDDYIYTSVNGINWYKISESFNFTEDTSIKYGNGLWVAGCGANPITPSIIYSHNGSNWLKADGSFNGETRNIAYGNGVWVAVGNSAENATTNIIYSTDGSNWLDTVGGFSVVGINVSYGNGLWVAVGISAENATSNIVYSTDGSNWINNSNIADQNYIGYVKYTSKTVPNQINNTSIEASSLVLNEINPWTITPAFNDLTFSANGYSTISLYGMFSTLQFITSNFI
jgi:hypothetical protein